MAVSPLAPEAYQDLVARALTEDIGSGDVTTLATVPPDVEGVGTFLVKRACTIAGLDVAAAVFAAVDATVRFEAIVADGDVCPVGTVVATVKGSAASLLTAERTALNFLQRMSGIATLTRRYVDATGGRITIIDTRKTTPTLRALEKYAVRCGGATSNRVGLFDAVLIKDNHVRLAGGIGPAVARARAAAPGLTVEVETQSLEQVRDAVSAGADIIMLDNMSDEEMREAMRMIDGRARVELSGGVTVDRMPMLASFGADTASVGAITHSAPASDISLEIECSIPSPTT